jgi:Ni/Co efflux regulator RcnB
MVKKILSLITLVSFIGVSSNLVFAQGAGQHTDQPQQEQQKQDEQKKEEKSKKEQKKKEQEKEEKKEEAPKQ